MAVERRGRQAGLSCLAGDVPEFVVRVTEYGCTTLRKCDLLLDDAPI
jgi:hypothetical protein